MRKIGITGGIGSGKSLVARVLSTMNFPIYHSDNQAKILMNKHPEIQQGLIGLFGEEVYKSGTINKTFLASQIFQNPEARLKVNQLVHPIVRADFNEWCLNQQSAFVFQESALLFETGAHALFDAVILVTAPENIRIQRVASRDNLPVEEVEKRIQSQLSDKEKMKFNPFIISNNGNEFIVPQVLTFLKSQTLK